MAPACHWRASRWSIAVGRMDFHGRQRRETHTQRSVKDHARPANVLTTGAYDRKLPAASISRNQPNSLHQGNAQKMCMLFDDEAISGRKKGTGVRRAEFDLLNQSPGSDL